MSDSDLFNLDTAKEEWRRELRQKYPLTNRELDELSDHLSCEIEQLMEHRASAEQAFVEARNKMGVGRKFSQELLSINYRDRLLRLPKPLLIVAVLSIVGAINTLLQYYWAFSLFPPKYHHVGDGLPPDQRPVDPGSTVSAVFFLVYGLGVFFLSAKLHKYLLIMSKVMTFALAIGCIAMIFATFTVNVSTEGIMRVGNSLVTEPWLRWCFWAFAVAYLYGSLAMYVWICKRLKQPDVKFLFGVIDGEDSDKSHAEVRG